MTPPLPKHVQGPRPGRIGWSSVPFFALHIAALAGALSVSFEWHYLVWAVALYYVRMFGITAGFHRYFAHRSFKTHRWSQFLLAWLGTSALQKGPLWWAAHHRDHHKYSDTPNDLHSPAQRGFWWSHMGWFLADDYNETRLERIRDFAKYPELLWLDKYHLVPPALLVLSLWAWGGLPLVIWGFLVSTVLLWHGTFFINSLAHVFGSRRYQTSDTSRNSWILALLTLGEGWHNNHHHYQSSANQGFFWWEVDGSYYTLKLLSWCRVVSDLRKPPARLLIRVREHLPSKEQLLAKLPAKEDMLALLPSQEEVWARFPRGEEVVARLVAAQLALTLFPARARARFLACLPATDSEAADKADGLATLVARLPDELIERLAEVGHAIEGLPEEVRSRLRDAERAWERLPEELRARLPSADEIMERLRRWEPAPA